MQLTKKELKIAKRISELKNFSGSHSPSLITLVQKIPEIKIKIDACFLSNPYATDVFFGQLQQDLIKNKKLKDFLEYYPSQNEIISEKLASILKFNPERIIVGNGGTELISAIFQNFSKDKILINLPTFSPYYEFAGKAKVYFHTLKEEDNFNLNIKNYLERVKKVNPDTVVIINPNNPDGGYVKYSEMTFLLEKLKRIPTVVIDESFIHFAFENKNFKLQSISKLVKKYPNLIVLKSMSKDFGIAGVRAGYAIMTPERVKKLLKNGFLWNSNGLAEYFFRLYSQKDFWNKYNKARMRYINETQEFFNELNKIKKIKVIPSMANFALIKLLDNTKAKDLTLALLIRKGIYVRDCTDKLGLKGEYVRIASRKKKENLKILKALREIL